MPAIGAAKWLTNRLLCLTQRGNVLKTKDNFDNEMVNVLPSQAIRPRVDENSDRAARDS
jgi:hypothetical protein